MNELERLMKRYPQLAGCRETITEAYQMLEESFRKGGKLLICGNGGSAADSDHIVGELMKGFKKQRPVPVEMRAKLGDLADHLQESHLPGIRRYLLRFLTMWHRIWFLRSRFMDMEMKMMCCLQSQHPVIQEMFCMR